MIKILQNDEKPSWVNYPDKYLDLINKEEDEFLPWYLMDKERILIRHKGLQKRYPARILFPFARHDYTDDVACWEKDKPGKVILLHDFASPGYENKMEFETFDEWYLFVTRNEN